MSEIKELLNEILQISSTISNTIPQIYLPSKEKKIIVNFLNDNANSSENHSKQEILLANFLLRNLKVIVPDDFQEINSISPNSTAISEEDKKALQNIKKLQSIFKDQIKMKQYFDEVFGSLNISDKPSLDLVVFEKELENELERVYETNGGN